MSSKIKNDDRNLTIIAEKFINFLFIRHHAQRKNHF